MKLNKFATFAVAVAVMALGFVACNNDGKDIVVKETDYAEVFLNTFEEKLNLLFQRAEADLRRGNHDFELLFKNAYLEALGSYADISTFENAFLEVSDKTQPVRTRSSIEETVFMNLTYRVIDSSETKKEAIGKFNTLASDVSLDLEDRAGFISMREFLSFYENNEELIIRVVLEKDFFYDLDEISREDGRRWIWGCIAGTLGSAINHGLQGCGVGAVVGAAAGTIVKPGGGTVAGVVKGCKIGGTIGTIGGALEGFANHCGEEFRRIIMDNNIPEIGAVLVP